MEIQRFGVGPFHMVNFHEEGDVLEEKQSTSERTDHVFKGVYPIEEMEKNVIDCFFL